MKDDGPGGQRSSWPARAHSPPTPHPLPCKLRLQPRLHPAEGALHGVALCAPDDGQDGAGPPGEHHALEEVRPALRVLGGEENRSVEGDAGEGEEMGA